MRQNIPLNPRTVRRCVLGVLPMLLLMLRVPGAIAGHVVVYQPFSDLPQWSPGPDEHVATTEPEFLALVDQYAADPNTFTGTIVITEGSPPGGSWPVCPEGRVHVWLKFHDRAYYRDVWLPDIENGWTPGWYEGLEADPPPTIPQSLYSLKVWNLEDEQTTRTTLMRVAKANGAIGLVWSLLESEPPGGGTNAVGIQSAEPCDAGPWWQYDQICCHVQALLCPLGRWIFPRADCDCESCYQDCLNCAVDNPCHSCDPCGLMGWLCQWFGKC
jgi:hypothetical protein